MGIEVVKETHTFQADEKVVVPGWDDLGTKADKADVINVQNYVQKLHSRLEEELRTKVSDIRDSVKDGVNQIDRQLKQKINKPELDKLFNDLHQRMESGGWQPTFQAAIQGITERFEASLHKRHGEFSKLFESIQKEVENGHALPAILKDRFEGFQRDMSERLNEFSKSTDEKACQMADLFRDCQVVRDEHAKSIQVSQSEIEQLHNQAKEFRNQADQKSADASDYSQQASQSATAASEQSQQSSRHAEEVLDRLNKCMGILATCQQLKADSESQFEQIQSSCEQAKAEVSRLIGLHERMEEHSAQARENAQAAADQLAECRVESELNRQLKQEVEGLRKDALQCQTSVQTMTNAAETHACNAQTSAEAVLTLSKQAAQHIEETTSSRNQCRDILTSNLQLKKDAQSQFNQIEQSCNDIKAEVALLVGLHQQMEEHAVKASASAQNAAVQLSGCQAQTDVNLQVKTEINNLLAEVRQFQMQARKAADDANTFLNAAKTSAEAVRQSLEVAQSANGSFWKRLCWLFRGMPSKT